MKQQEVIPERLFVFLAGKQFDASYIPTKEVLAETVLSLSWSGHVAG
jgi:hypothetical protein